MKRKNWLIGYLLVLLCTACTDNNMTDMQNNENGVCFKVEDFHFEKINARTSVEITDKAAVFSWAANDTIGIFPEADASQARFSMVSGSGTKKAIFDGGGWALKPNARYASYYPYIADVNLDKYKVPVNYVGQIQTHNDNTTHLGAFDYMAAHAVVPVEENVEFTFKHLGCLLQLNLNIPQADEILSVTLSSEENMFIDSGHFNLMVDDISIEPQTYTNAIKLEMKDISVDSNTPLIAYLMLAPANLNGKQIHVSVQGAINEYNGVFTAKNLLDGTAYSFAATLKMNANTGGDENNQGVLNVATPGTLYQLLGENLFKLDSLTLSGALNSEDVAWLRRMSGGIRDTLDTEFGCLKYLDLSRITFKPDFSYYLDDGEKYSVTKTDALGDCMFAQCSNLVELILPSSLKSIGEASLSGCSKLSKLIIPEGVTSLGISALNGCKSLKELSLPQKLVEIGRDAFHGSGLLSLRIPDGVKLIALNTFGHCENLVDIVLPNGLTSIGNGAFAACNQLSSITLPASLKSVGERAFSSCTSLKDIIIGSGDTELASYAFENCTGIEQLTFPEGVTSIGNRVFYGCSQIKDITLPSTLQQIGTRAFYAAAAKNPIVVKCHAVTPPELAADVWKKTDSKLYVPAASMEAYRMSAWKEYFNEIIDVQ